MSVNYYNYGFILNGEQNVSNFEELLECDDVDCEATINSLVKDNKTYVYIQTKTKKAVRINHDKLMERYQTGYKQVSGLEKGKKRDMMSFYQTKVKA